jgi:4-amino-4-deoxy-L-arabinose transferase-like glycosyltransferase
MFDRLRPERLSGTRWARGEHCSGFRLGRYMTGVSSPNRPRNAAPFPDGATPASGHAKRRSLRARWRTATPRGRYLTAALSLLALALLVRVAYVLHTTNYRPVTDALSYNILASGLARGHGWVYGSSAYVPPGYPFFLAAIYHLVGIPHGVWTAPRIAEAFLATVTVLLAGLMALQLAGRAAMLIALAIGALYVPLVLVGVSLMTESLFVPLVLAAVNCALHSRAAEHRYRWIAAAGLFCGLGGLTRGNGIVVGFALAVLVWTGRPRWSLRALGGPATLLLVMALTISPWTIRNAITEHQFVPVTTELGLTLAGTYNNHSARERFIWEFAYPNYRAIKKNPRLNDAQQSNQLISAVFGYIGRHPAYLPEAIFWNSMRLLDLQGRRVSRMTAFNDTRATARFADLGVISFWITGLLAIVGLFTNAVRRIPRAFWLTPLLLWLSVAPLSTGTPRFRAALDPFVILLAAVAIETIAMAMVRRRAARRSADSLTVAPTVGRAV